MVNVLLLMMQQKQEFCTYSLAFVKIGMRCKCAGDIMSRSVCTPALMLKIRLSMPCTCWMSRFHSWTLYIHYSQSTPDWRWEKSNLESLSCIHFSSVWLYSAKKLVNSSNKDSSFFCRLLCFQARARSSLSVDSWKLYQSQLETFVLFIVATVNASDMSLIGFDVSSHSWIWFSAKFFYMHIWSSQCLPKQHVHRY